MTLVYRENAKDQIIDAARCTLYLNSILFTVKSLGAVSSIRPWREWANDNPNNVIDHLGTHSTQNCQNYVSLPLPPINEKKFTLIDNIVHLGNNRR